MITWATVVPQPPRKRAPRHAMVVIELLKEGPLTQQMVRNVKNLRATIHHLREQGWPITTEMRDYWTKYGKRIRAEYRLGDWRQIDAFTASKYLKQIETNASGAVDSEPGTNAERL